MIRKKEKINLFITEVEYGYLFPLVLDIPADCYTDYFFESESFDFRKNKAAIFIRENNDNYNLIMEVTKVNNGKYATKTLEKTINAKDFIWCLKRGIPRDLIEDFPLKWRNNSLEHREIIHLSHVDEEQWNIALPDGINIKLKEIDCVNTTRYEIEFEYADESELASVKKYLQAKGINFITQKKSGYELFFEAWKKSFIGTDADSENEIKITFKSKLFPGYTHERTFTLSLRTVEGKILHKIFVNHAKEEFGVNVIVWQEPKGLLDKARYIASNLKKALAKVELSDRYNGSDFREDSNNYKFYGITQKEYLAVKRAEIDFYNIVTTSTDERFRNMAFGLVDQNLSYQGVADKYFDGNISKANYEIKKFHEALAENYGRLAKTEAGEYPPFDELSPIHKQFIQTAFNLLVAMGEEEYDMRDLQGANLYWDYLYSGKCNISQEDLKKLIDLYQRLFGLG